VQLDWSVSAEVNLVGYKIMRAEGGGPFIWLQNLGNNGVIPAQGNAPADYQALDTTAVNGRTYHYRLLALQDNMSEVDLGVRTVTLMDIDLVSFTASPLNNAALLEWTTQAEFNVGAYRIERGHNGTFIWLQGLGDNGYIPAKGGPQLTANYAVMDNTAVNGNTYDYRLIAVQDEPNTLEREVGQDTLVLNHPIFMPLLVRP
jgi:hypothetical protein